MWYVCDVCLLFYYCIYWTSSLLINFSNFSNIGSTLSKAIKLDDSTLAFTDYLNNPTYHRFIFINITKKETLTIMNNLKSKNFLARMKYPTNY